MASTLIKPLFSSQTAGPMLSGYTTTTSAHAAHLPIARHFSPAIGHSKAVEEKLLVEIDVLRDQVQVESENRNFKETLLNEFLNLAADSGEIDAERSSVDRPSRKPSQAIRELLSGNPGGLVGSEIADQLQGIVVTRSENKRNIVFTTLYNMKKSGRLAHSKGTERYSMSE